MHKVALLIPTTSNNRPQWNTIKDTYLFHSIKSFLVSLHYQDNNRYVVYIGYDEDDRLFSKKKQQDELKRFEQDAHNSYQRNQQEAAKHELSQMEPDQFLFDSVQAYDDFSSQDEMYQTISM